EGQPLKAAGREIHPHRPRLVVATTTTGRFLWLPPGRPTTSCGSSGGTDDVLLAHGGRCAGAEAADVQGGDVERRTLAPDQGRHLLADGGPEQEAVPGEAGGVDEPGQPGRHADQAVVVRRHLVEARPAGPDLDV